MHSRSPNKLAFRVVQSKINRRHNYYKRGKTNHYNYDFVQKLEILSWIVITIQQLCVKRWWDSDQNVVAISVSLVKHKHKEINLFRYVSKIF
jgi:hypothetical protein